MDEDKIKNVILDTTISSLEAQLRAVRRLRGGKEEEEKEEKGMSMTDMVYDILLREGKPLHITSIIKKVSKIHGITIDRESIVSSLSKKIKKGERFVRVGRNIFALREEKQ